MNKVLLLAGVAASVFAFNANAIEFNPYVSGKLTYSDMSFDGKDTWTGGTHPGSAKNDMSDEVWGFGIAAGISSSVPGGALRTELEYNYNDKAEESIKLPASSEKGKMSLRTQSLFLNAYYDINTNTKFTPYVGGGIGYAKVKGKLAGAGMAISKDDTNFAWQLGAGVSYAVNDNVSVDLGYRYTDMGDISKEYLQGRTFKSDIESQEVLLGARYTF